MQFSHVSVMLKETVDLLNVREGGIYVDGTLGGGGHSEEILRRLGGGGHLYGIDRDDDALAAASARLAGAGNFTAVKGNFHDVRELLSERGVTAIDGMTVDLGVSSWQLDAPERGFSYHGEAPLDMRMDQRQPLTAATIVNEWPQEEIARILRENAEEKWAARIAAIICEHREQKPLAHAGRGTQRPPDLSGAAHRGQRRTGAAFAGAVRHGQDAAARRASGGADLPLAGGPHRKADLPPAGQSVHLPAENPGVRLRQDPAGPPAGRGSETVEGRNCRQPARAQRDAARRGAP